MKTRTLLLVIVAMRLLNSGFANLPDVLRTNIVKQYHGFELVAFSQDGTLLATASIGDGPEVMVLNTGDLSHVWADVNEVYDGWIPLSLAFAADNGLVACGVSHRAGGVFDVNSAAQVSELSRYQAVAFTPSTTSNVLISAGLNGVEKRVISFGLPESPILFPGSGQSAKVITLAFEPNGASFWLGNEAGIIQHWQMDPPQLLWQTNFPNNSVSAINFFSDGRQIITLSSNLSTYNNYRYWSDLRLWEIGQTNFLFHLQPDFPFFSSTLTPDGKYLFTPLKTWDDNDYDTNHIVVWRVVDGREMVRYDEQVDGVQQVAIAPNGKTFAYGRGDNSWIVAIARMPVFFDQITRTGNQTILKWQGGSGLYQVQSRTNFTSDVWHELGSSTTNTVATNLSSTTTFYRVQSLPVP